MQRTLEKDIATIKVKYPSVKWIDLMPMMRCPNNQHCNAMASYGPGANADPNREDCYVPPYQDSAMAKVAAAHPDSVGVGPVLMSKNCPSSRAVHYGTPDNQIEANEIGAFCKGPAVDPRQSRGRSHAQDAPLDFGVPPGFKLFCGEATARPSP